jgi:Fe-S cluster assembly protein SufD
MNLLLGDDAMVNTKPQLEIFADDVRCTHGATIGRLDDEAMFYLRSRGIAKDEARSLLIYAFASDVLDRIGIEVIRDTLEARLFQRFLTTP